MKKLGRPKLPQKDRKLVFPLRFSRSELGLFEQAAKEAGKGIREWIAETLENAAHQKAVQNP